MNEVLHLFKYDPTSPTFLRWTVDRGKAIPAGSVAGWVHPNGYVMVASGGKNYTVSRIVWELINGDDVEGFEIDHIDGNPLNNAVGNLRKVPRSLNCKNRRKRCDNKTGHVGISKQDSGNGRFYIVAQFNVGGKMVRKRWPLKGRLEQDVVAEAVAWRNSQRETMLAEGYTERHINANT